MPVLYGCSRLLFSRLVGLLLLWLAAPALLHAQAPSWQAAITASPATGSSYTIGPIALDAADNLYIIGNFSGTVAFGGTTLVSAGGTDGFVAKWSPTTNQFLWASALGGSQNERLLTLAVQGTSLYVGGSFEGTWGAGSTQLTSAGGTDGLVAKLTDIGPGLALVWAQRLGGPLADYVSGVAVSGTGVFATGNFVGSINVGSSQLVSAGDADMFVVKLLDSGPSSSVAWVQQAGGTLRDQANGIAVSGASVYIVGLFYGTTHLGSTSLTSAGIYDGFVAKLTDAGTSASFGWTKQVGFYFLDEVRAVAVQGNAVYITGFFDTLVQLDAITLTARDMTDVFVAKLFDTGPQASYAWAAQGGALMDDFANALLVRGTDVYIGGGVTTGATFGTDIIWGSGTYVFFVAQLTDNGSSYTWKWAKGVGGAGYNLASSIAVPASGLVYAAGIVGAPVSFGSYPLASNLTGQVGVVARLAPSTLTATSARASTVAIGLYPTPAHGLATVQLPAGLAAGPATLTLLDALGRTVRARTVALSAGSSQAAFDVAGLAPGVYTLHVAVGERTSTARLVVE